MAKKPLIATVKLAEYVFSNAISANPDSTDISRALCLRERVDHMRVVNQKMILRYDLVHYNRNYLISDMDGLIEIVFSSNGSRMYPTLLNISGASLTGTDSELIPEINFINNWLKLRDDERLYKVLAKWHDIKSYDINGEPVVNGTGVYSYIDCLYYDLIK